MRRSLLTTTIVVLAAAALNAQDRFAYAITDLTSEGAGWNTLRKIDLATGQYSDVLLNGSDASLAIYDASNKKKMSLAADVRYGQMLNTPFGTGVAAAAYDKKHNRLYFTPMFVDQLRYIDLSNMKVYYVTNQSFTNSGNMHNDEGKVITRMVIAPDGYGYAISNDGNTFVRFATNKKGTVEQLGALVDDPSNNGISIHNKCTSYGGDMIADDKGNLYIISARNQVFVVSTETRAAKHLGAVSNLPKGYTINGAVVDAEGALLVSSAVNSKSYYVVNPKDWSAQPYAATSPLFRASDLANSNYLAARAPQKPEFTNVELIKNPESEFSNLVKIFPNPVRDNNIQLQFSKVPQGDYTIELTDFLGRSVMQKRININSESQTSTLTLNRAAAKGTYMVRLVNRDKVGVFYQKVIVQ